MLYISNNRGFSLIELLVGMIIMVIILGGITTLFSSLLQVQTYTLSKSANIQDVSNAVNQISEEISFAYGKSMTYTDIDTGTDKSPGPTNTANEYNLDELSSPIKTRELFFTRRVGDNQNDKETRHIYIKDNSIIIDHGPSPNTTKPLKVNKTVKLAVGSVSNDDLSFVIDKLDDNKKYNDDDLSGGNKRLKITVTVTANTRRTTSGSSNDGPIDPRQAVFTTQVITSNSQF